MASEAHLTPPMPEAWRRGVSGNAGDSGLGSLMRDMIALIRRNLWWILLINLVAMGLAVGATMLETPRYLSASRLQINDQSDRVLGDELESQSVVNTNWDVDRFLNTQMEILRSRSLAERVVRKLELAGNQRFFEAMGAQMPATPEGQAGANEQAVVLLRSGLVVTLPRDTRIVTIGYLSADPAMSARIANAYAEEYIQSNLQRRFDSSAYARQFVSEQLEEARNRLEESERELNAYARNAGLIRTRDADTTASNSIVNASLAQLNEEANRAQATRVAAEARWRAEQSVPLLSSQTVLESQAVQSLMTEKARLESSYDSARQRYLAGHPELTRLSGDLQAVTAQLEATALQVRDSVRGAYLAARQTEQRLREEVDRLENATLAEQDRAVRYNTLAREADTNRSLYDGLLQRFRELNASAGIATSNVAIIDQAQVPKAPFTPNPLKNAAFGLLFGLGLSAGLLFLRSQLDDVIRAPEDVEAKTGLPLLGVIPRARGDDPEDELDDPRSALSEAYNSLRGTLLYSSRSGLPRILLVTSAAPTEGKSTTSLATASSLARMGKRTVLVDGDLRRPSVHRRTAISNEVGLSSLLVSRDDAATSPVETGEANLFVLPSGPIPPSPTELLTSPRMAQILEQLASAFDVVVVDSPPVLGLADAPVLAALADGVVVVAEADRGRGGALKTALRRLRAMDSVLLGVVLTKFSATRAGYGYSQYYGYDYYRYDSADDGPK